MTAAQKMPQPLSAAEVRDSYQRLAGIWGLVGRYEAIATHRLFAPARFDTARSVFEFGCGNGAFAAELLARHLPATARYTGVDLAPRMVAACRRRLAPYAGRATVEQTAGGPPVVDRPGGYDRFVSNFVLDLLADDERRALLAAARRMLDGDGLLALASLAPGDRVLSRALMRGWERLFRVAPQWLGGCRPLQLHALLEQEGWQILHRETVTPLLIPLEIVVARLAPGPGASRSM